MRHGSEKPGNWKEAGVVGGREEDKDKVRKAGLVRQIRPESRFFLQEYRAAYKSR